MAKEISISITIPPTRWSFALFSSPQVVSFILKRTFESIRQIDELFFSPNYHYDQDLNETLAVSAVLIISKLHRG